MEDERVCVVCQKSSNDNILDLDTAGICDTCQADGYSQCTTCDSVCDKDRNDTCSGCDQIFCQSCWDHSYSFDNEFRICMGCSSTIVHVVCNECDDNQVATQENDFIDIGNKCKCKCCDNMVCTDCFDDTSFEVDDEPTYLCSECRRIAIKKVKRKYNDKRVMMKRENEHSPIIATGETWPCRDIFTKFGFTWDKQKRAWTSDPRADVKIYILINAIEKQTNTEVFYEPFLASYVKNH